MTLNHNDFIFFVLPKLTLKARAVIKHGTEKGSFEGAACVKEHITFLGVC